MLINEIIDNFNVKTIEMHIDLDGKGFEANKGHCWMPNDLSLLKDFLSNKKKIYGNYKKDFSKAETLERLHRSDPSDGLRTTKKSKKNKNMRYLITGHAGFIGSALSNLLVLNKKDTVVGLDNFNKYYDVSLKKKRVQMIKKKSKKNFKSINCDLRNKVKTKKNFFKIQI